VYDDVDDDNRSYPRERKLLYSVVIKMYTSIHKKNHIVSSKSSLEQMFQGE